jgi:hypothetical protein
MKNTSFLRISISWINLSTSFSSNASFLNIQQMNLKIIAFQINFITTACDINHYYF